MTTVSASFRGHDRGFCPALFLRPALRQPPSLSSPSAMASHHSHSHSHSHAHQAHAHYAPNPHRSLVPPPPPPQLVPQPNPNPIPAQQAPANRLIELLDCVKAEYDSLQAEAQHLKSQSSEVDSHVTACTSDLSQLREQYYQLDRDYQRLKSQYDDELRRLRIELDQRRNSTPAPATASSMTHEARGPPNLPPTALPLGGSNFGALSGAASQPNRDSPYSNGSNLRNDTLSDPQSGHPNKRLRSERESQDGGVDLTRNPNPQPNGPSMNSKPAPLGVASPPVMTSSNNRVPETKNKAKPLPEGPYSSKLGGPPNPSHPYATSAGNSYHPRGDAGPVPPQQSHHLPGSSVPPPSANVSSSSAPNPPVSGAGSNGNDLLDLDPDSLPSSMKKEGVDWMTMFNPKVKKVLDVGLVHTLVHDSVVCCVKFSPDGSILATGCNRHTTLYDTRTGSKICTLLDDGAGPKAADNYIRSASFSPDGHLLATGSEDRMIRIWEVNKKRILNRLQGHKSEIYSLAFSPDGRMLVSGSGDKTSRIWDMNSGACLFNLVIEESGVETGSLDAGVTSVCVSPDGTLLATGSLDTVVRLWDTSNGRLLDKLRGHQDSVYSVAFSPDGKFLVSGSLDKTLKIWDLLTLNREGNSSGASAAVMLKREDGGSTGLGNGTGGNNNGNAQDADQVMSDRGLDLGRPSTMCTTTLTGHKDYVLSVAVSPDGQWIMSGSKDRGVQFWDPKTAMAQFMLQGHKNSVISIAVSDAGGLLATGSGDWHARIWSYEKIVK